MTDAVWIPVYVGMGSNLEDPPSQLDRARESLARLPDTRLVVVSAYYRNPPMGVLEQPDFVNAVAGLLTRLPPRDLLAALKGIERAHGREPSSVSRWGPRVLDLDLLVYGTVRMAEPGLVLPHPGIAQRNFVLFPLMQIAPGLDVPGTGQVGDLAARLDSAGLERLA
jgi:2-amino-4-hydroxy-6-hydroxymethyldihydropteridine diphosphokinase